MADANASQLRVGITGADGFLGWHLRCRLHPESGVSAVCAGRTEFGDQDLLAEFVRSCDVIVHLAAVNRGTDAEVGEVNPALASALVDALTETGSTPALIYSSTTHEDRDTIYGLGKREAGDILDRWASASGSTCTRLILPHVFGECGKPFYNSVVSTFCHQLAHGDEPKIIDDIDLELLHAQDIADHIASELGCVQSRTVRLNGSPMKVSELLRRLEAFRDTYASHLLPSVADALDLRLFNTYRSYLFPHAYPMDLELNVDPRGELFEAVKSVGGGQTFLSTTRPGITRGDHYHRAKIERFLVIAGEATIRIRRMFDSQTHEFVVHGSKPQYIDMPALHTHNITNTGSDDVVTLFWANEIFDPARPDTYPETV